ncbi:MAG: hypothetical protein SH847_12580, partial [Roseiflexaceae bacterium]|nr:hypothetical protein [Roseiflexaceae bacterium]
ILTNVLVAISTPQPSAVLAGTVNAPSPTTNTATSVPTVTLMPTITNTLQPSATPTTPATPTSTELPTPTPTLTPTILPTAVPVPYEEYIDTTTQESDMHACPHEYATAGVNVVENKLLCRRVILAGDAAHIQTFLDTGTVRASMHACPTGTYIRGLRVDRNQLLCSYDDRLTLIALPEIEDSTSQGYGMHICPNPASPGRRVLTGIHVDQNRFLCGLV